MELIDTHCHIDVDEFSSDRELVIQRAKKAGVKTLVIPGITADRWQQLASIADKSPELHFALGLHPYFIDQHTEQDLEELEQLLDQLPVIAIGEIGLDYYDGSLDPERQRYFFEKQVLLAEKFSLPIIIHSRKSQDDILRILKKADFSQGGTMHAFNGSLQQAQAFIALGFKLGFGGMITFERSSKLRKLAKQLPLDSIVLETDSPYMTVSSHQGQRNSPEYLPEVLQSLAEIRQQRPEVIANQTSENARKVFHLIQ